MTTAKRRDCDDKYNNIELVVHTKMVHIRLGINFHDAVRKIKLLLPFRCIIENEDLYIGLCKRPERFKRFRYIITNYIFSLFHIVSIVNFEYIIAFKSFSLINL